MKQLLLAREWNMFLLISFWVLEKCRGTNDIISPTFKVGSMSHSPVPHQLTSMPQSIFTVTSKFMTGHSFWLTKSKKNPNCITKRKMYILLQGSMIFYIITLWKIYDLVHSTYLKMWDKNTHCACIKRSYTLFTTFYPIRNPDPIYHSDWSVTYTDQLLKVQQHGSQVSMILR